MKLTGALLICVTLQVGAHSFAQNVNIHERGSSLKTVLNSIRKQTGYYFMYDKSVIEKTKSVDVNATNQDLQVLLNELASNYKLSFELKNKVIVVTLSEATAKKIDLIPPISITGKIHDANGLPLIGATVRVKGLAKGTQADSNGNFSLADIDSQAVLIVSFTGYITEEVAVSGQKELIIALKEDVKGLGEVLVVGYGTQKKANLTGAVASVSGDELNKRVATNPGQLLQGKLPGLQVTQSSGEAGNEGNVLRIRGLGTYSGAGTNPLVIVDGIPGELAALNPENIESVTVLKDAASASIYGSRAANGVILVTTKKGKAGKMQVIYSYNLGIAKATSLPDLIYNSVQYMQLYNQAAINSGVAVASRFTQAQIDAYANATDKNLYPDFNWLDETFKTAKIQTHNLSLSGGNHGTTYNVGLGYVDQPDIMYGFSYKKLNLQIGLTSKINDRISFGSNFTINYGKRVAPQVGSQAQFTTTLAQTPLSGPYLPDGSGRYTFTAYAFQPTNRNPVASANTSPLSVNDYYLQGNLFVDVKLLEGLQWKTSVGTNFNFQKTYIYRPVVNQYLWFAGPSDAPFKTLDVGGQGLEVTDNNYLYPIGYSQFTYNKKIGAHSFTALGGTQAEYYKSQSLSGSRVNYPNDSVQELDAGGTGSQLNGGTASEWAIKSFYGRLNYDFQGKYLIEGNMRYDGSSRFAGKNKWGFFPSVSVGYRISQENFFKNLLAVVSDLKFRVSSGKLGNQNIGNYPYQDVYSTGFSYPLGSTLSDGVRQTRLVDQNIVWESTDVFNLGADIAFFNNKLNVTADYYNKVTSGILSAATIPIYVGLTAPTVNNGTIRNRGLELTASYRDKVGKFGYAVTANFQSNQNKLINYGATVIGSNTINQVGQPYGSFYLYQFDKIFQSAAEIAQSATQPYNPVPGTMKFKDINSDGKIDENDRSITPGIFPAYDYSLSTNFDYQNFDLSIFLYGSQGQKLYVNGWGLQPFNQGSVPPVEWLNAWTPDNPSTTLPMIYITGTGNVSQNATTISTYYLEDASFLRIKNIQLGYNFPQKLIKKAGLNGLRLFFAGENLFTFSKFPGLDPERVASNTRYVAHPQNKTYNFGARLTF